MPITQTFTTGDDTYLADQPDTYDLTFLAGNDTLTVNNALATVLAHMDEGNDIVNLISGTGTIYGGLGDDTYNVDASGFSLIEAAGEGTDLINASISWVLGSNFENLTLTGGAAINGTGNSLANIITGNDAANQLSGGADNDTLIGNGGNDRLNGGTGQDNMVGGLGDDIYFVDNVADQAIELSGEGTDLVVTSVDFTLAANVENLQLANVTNTSGTGNELANVITGNAGDNHLFGMAGADTILGNAGNDVIDGGTGADKMYGGTGDDTFYIDNALDVVGENAGEGNDTAYSSVSWTIGINVETLNLTGTAAINGYGNVGNETINGNSANNTLTGNAGNDVLNGGDGNDILNGGTGVDTMAGGLGNDNYYVDNLSDVVIENAGEGIDVVNSAVTWTLDANTEHLTLRGADNIDGTGNAIGNELRGNNGDNVLNGLGGNDKIYGFAGDDTINGGDGNDQIFGYGDADTLTGGAGKDVFWFTTLIDSRPGSYDTITDFTSTQGETSPDDQIDLSKIDADTSLAGDQAFIWAGLTATAHGAWTTTPTVNPDGSADWVLYADVNGDTTPEVEIHFHTMTAQFFNDDITL